MNALLEMELENLYEIFESSETELEQEPSKRFYISDLNGANWVFRKIKALQQKIDENKSLAIDEKDRIDNWLATQNQSAQRDIEFFQSVVIEYFITERAKDNKYKLTTPYGKVNTRKSKKWTYDDETLIKSLKEINLPEYIKITEGLKKEELKEATKKKRLLLTDSGKLATFDGEIIEGVLVTDSESISIKVE